MVRFLTVSYQGTKYAGWQRQPNAMTVQERLEAALSEFLDGNVRAVGAGRTDAGVHARGQVAHIEKAPERQAALPNAALVHGTNKHLPRDIRVLAAKRMPGGTHARKSASSKLYAYRCIRARVLSPLDEIDAIPVDPSIDVLSMREAATRLEGRHDFSAFALSGGTHQSPVRRLMRAEVREDGRQISFWFEGEGFLRGMVRSMVGTLLEVGSHRREPAWIDTLVAGVDRSEAGPTAPARGLTLERVFYPISSAR